ncbi:MULTISPECIES: ATP F0F1 synthase subunit B [Afifella]|uniref:F0F1 ATP synthase subunit B family protein n=1 Tax=Afifella TaxID=643217 RepID=UPI000FE3D838|nr:MULTISPECIES: ATP F0F1 synthase subunit B [Afifella]MCF1504442.1 ATP F0F1 synthase subunit B [Afifella sp. H1R]MCT8266967.1 ATP F0F1 synthase subunit B [Afifella sp. JA880]
MDATSLASLWVFIGLLTFLGIMIYLGVPKMMTAALDKRSEKIQHELDEARRLREEAQALLAEYQRRRQEAEEEAAGIVALAENEAAAHAAEAKQRLEEYIERRTRGVEQRIAQAEAQAVSDVKARAVDVAVAASAKILAEQNEGAVGQRLINSSIEGLKRH